MTCGILEIQPGEAGLMKTHQHPQSEIYHILSGKGLMTIGTGDHAVRLGSTIYIPGSSPHRLQNTGEKILRLFYVFPRGLFR